MPTWQADIFGDQYEIDAPDEGQAATQALKLRQQAAQADPKKAAAWVHGQPADQREQASSEASRSPMDNAFQNDLASSQLGDIAGSVATGARNLAEGTAGMAGDFLGLGARAGDFLAQKLGGASDEDVARAEAVRQKSLQGYVPTTQDIHDATSEYVGSSYQPATAAGKIAKTGTELSSVLVSPGSAGRKALTWAGATAGNEGAGELAHNFAPGLEPYARLAGSVVGGGAASLAGGRGSAQHLPTAADIKKSAGYPDLKGPMQAAKIDQSEYQGIVKQLGEVAQDFGMVPEQHGPIATILLRHAQKAGEGGASLQDLETMRRSLLNAGKNPMNPSAGELSGQLIDTLDNAVEDIGAAKMAGAEPGATSTVDALKEARSIWATGKKSEVIEKAMERAKNAASGAETGLRAEFRKILNSPKLSRQFTDAEQQAMQGIVRGTFKGNMLRLLGGFGVPLDNARNFLGSVIGGGVGATIGSAVAGPAGAMIGGPLLTGIGTAAKAAASKLTQNQAQLVEAMVKAGPKAGEIFAQATKELSAAEKTKILKAMTLLQGASLPARAPVEQ